MKAEAQGKTFYLVDKSGLSSKANTVEATVLSAEGEADKGDEGPSIRVVTGLTDDEDSGANSSDKKMRGTMVRQKLKKQVMRRRKASSQLHSYLSARDTPATMSRPSCGSIRFNAT